MSLTNNRVSTPTTPRLNPKRRELRDHTVAAFADFLRIATELDAASPSDVGIYGRHTRCFNELIDNTLLCHVDWSRWSNAGLVALMGVILERADLPDARKIGALIAEDLESAQYFEAHAHFADDRIAIATCAVCREIGGAA